jgi:putative spermidine/putrescine transport system substrate-binding protein
MMTASPTARTLIGIIAIVVSLAPMAQGAETLRITSTGGGFQEAQRKAFFQPFEKDTGIRISINTWNDELSIIRAMVTAGAITSDLFSANPHHAVAGCDEGILERIDQWFLGDAYDFWPGAILPCGVSFDLYARIWVFDADRTQPGSAAKRIRDIFDVSTYPGKRGFRKEVRGIAEWALMADGVPTSKVYEVLGTPVGLNRALAKLETIRKEIVWYTHNQQGAQLLIDGELTYLQIPSNRFTDIVTKDRKNLVAIWDGQVYTFDTWVIPRGAPNKALAMKFIEYAIHPRRVAEFAALASVAPVRKSASQYVKTEQLRNLPTSHFENALNIDDKFWADNLDAYTRRFEAWLQQ